METQRENQNTEDKTSLSVKNSPKTIIHTSSSSVMFVHSELTIDLERFCEISHLALKCVCNLFVFGVLSLPCDCTPYNLGPKLLQL